MKKILISLFCLILTISFIPNTAIAYASEQNNDNQLRNDLSSITSIEQIEDNQIYFVGNSNYQVFLNFHKIENNTYWIKLANENTYLSIEQSNNSIVFSDYTNNKYQKWNIIIENNNIYFKSQAIDKVLDFSDKLSLKNYKESSSKFVFIKTINCTINQTNDLAHNLLNFDINVNNIPNNNLYYSIDNSEPQILSFNNGTFQCSVNIETFNNNSSHKISIIYLTKDSYKCSLATHSFTEPAVPYSNSNNTINATLNTEETISTVSVNSDLIQGQEVRFAV